MLPTSVTLTLAAANAANIVASNTPAAAGNLTLVGSATVTLDVARRALVTYGNEGSARTIIITGSDRSGAPISETLAVPSGGGGTVYTLQDFLKVSAVTVAAAWTAAMTVGTNGIGSTAWIVPNRELTPANIGIGVIVTGTVNFTVEYTYDDPLRLPSGLVVPAVWPLSALAAKAANTDSAITAPVAAYRLTVNSGTGSARMSSVQAGGRQ